MLQHFDFVILHMVLHIPFKPHMPDVYIHIPLASIYADNIR
jgi:hypothetical protein